MFGKSKSSKKSVEQSSCAAEEFSGQLVATGSNVLRKRERIIPSEMSSTGSNIVHLVGNNDFSTREEGRGTFEFERNSKQKVKESRSVCEKQ